MLSGQYDFLVDNPWLAEILAIIFLVIPVFLIFMKSKWIFFYYTISIVANLPLIFSLVFNFSYEAILFLVIIIVLVKDIIKKRGIRFLTTKENLIMILMIILVMFVNLVTSFFNFNGSEFILRLYIYLVNLAILGIYTYYFIDYKSLEVVRNGFLVGVLILIFSMVIELIYGHYELGVRNMRPAGLLLDPNVCAFTLNLGLIISFINRKKNIFIYDLFYILIRVLIIFAIFLTVSRSAYLGTIYILIALVIHYSKNKQRWIAPTVIVIFIAMYLIFAKTINNFISNIYQMIDLNRIFPKQNIPPPPTNGNGGIVDIPGDPDYSNSRLDLIRAALVIFANNFVVGVGIGNLVFEMELLTNLPMNAHNLLLQLLAESGIFMLFTLLIAFYFLIGFLNKVEKKNKAIVFLFLGLIFIESLFNHNLLNINIIYLIFAIIFALVALSAKEKRVYLITRENLKIRKKIYL